MQEMVSETQRVARQIGHTHTRTNIVKLVQYPLQGVRLTSSKKKKKKSFLFTEPLFLKLNKQQWFDPFLLAPSQSQAVHTLIFNRGHATCKCSQQARAVRAYWPKVSRRMMVGTHAAGDVSSASGF